MAGLGGRGVRASAAAHAPAVSSDSASKAASLLWVLSTNSNNHPRLIQASCYCCSCVWRRVTGRAGGLRGCALQAVGWPGRRREQGDAGARKRRVCSVCIALLPLTCLWQAAGCVRCLAVNPAGHSPPRLHPTSPCPVPPRAHSPAARSALDQAGSRPPCMLQCNAML